MNFTLDSYKFWRGQWKFDKQNAERSEKIFLESLTDGTQLITVSYGIAVVLENGGDGRILVGYPNGDFNTIGIDDIVSVVDNGKPCRCCGKKYSHLKRGLCASCYYGGDL